MAPEKNKPMATLDSDELSFVRRLFENGGELKRSRRLFVCVSSVSPLLCIRNSPRFSLSLLRAAFKKQNSRRLLCLVCGLGYCSLLCGLLRLCNSNDWAGQVFPVSHVSLSLPSLSAIRSEIAYGLFGRFLRMFIYGDVP